MPGIVGLITRRPRSQATPELLRMLGVMQHEAFYRSGIWADDRIGIYIGWTAREGSFSDGMPLRNENGDVILVFSGEEFPAPGTSQWLKEHGHGFEPHGASYLVHLYEDNPTFPANLNGMFQGLLADLRCGTAILFNDRYGMHRIYYHESKGTFYFAAEAKAILGVRPELRVADARSLGEYVACGCVLQNRTLFHNIALLPPAAAWRFRNGTIETKGEYFQPQDWEEQSPLQPESYYRELRTVFVQNLPRYFNARERIGISLTGGLDTRAIVAWHKSSPYSVPCYTFGGMYRDCRDAHVARQVAAVCQQSHEVISVGQDFLRSFPEYAQRSIYLSDGCANVSRSPDLYVNERARKIAPVRMTGLFGDEVLRHNRTFKATFPESGIFHEDVLPFIHQAAATYTDALKIHPLSFSLFRQAPWNHYGSWALEMTQVALRTPFLDNDLVRTMYCAPDGAAETNDYRLRLIQDGSPTLRRIVTDRALGSPGLRGWVMRAYQEFTFKAEYAYDYGMPQCVAKIDRLLSALQLERLFLGRHKFYHFRLWYRRQLSDYVRQILLDPLSLSRPYLRPACVEAIVSAHTRGTHNYTSEIHQLLTLELIHRLFLKALPFQRHSCGIGECLRA